MSDLPQIKRHWLLLRTLGARRMGSSVGDLAREFAVNEKTIRRDLEQLRRLGFPLREEQVQKGKKLWFVTDVHDIPGLSLDFTELLSLFLARRLLEPLAGTYFWDGSQSLFRKLRSTLSEQALQYLNKISDLIHDPRQRSSNYRDHGEIIDQLMIGIEDRCFTFITYQSAKSTEPVTYDIHPYGLVHHRGSLYLVADSQHHGEFRVFKVERISDATTEPLKFDKKEFDLKAFFNSSFGIWHAEGELSHVVVRFAPNVARYIHEHHWPGCVRTQTTSDGSVVCEFQLSGLQEIKSWILSFGANATVLEPDELVQSVVSDLDKLMTRYRKRGQPSRAPIQETQPRNGERKSQ